MHESQFFLTSVRILFSKYAQLNILSTDGKIHERFLAFPFYIRIVKAFSSARWDMSKNTSLKALAVEDFSRLNGLEMIDTAPALEWLSIGNAVWAKSLLIAISRL